MVDIEQSMSSFYERCVLSCVARLSVSPKYGDANRCYELSSVCFKA